ncbi:hypothetical protein SH668x_001278 [Planctomicrobium sp. SH668]|uniref:hypothetical protein n=1 Tax=Planctomicrobium sp. SH668 TaxID=3448126 RepID=UPI003F5BE728
MPSTIRWRGDAPAKAQTEARVLSGTWKATDEIRFTINGKVAVIVAGSTAIPSVIQHVVSAFNTLPATSYPEFSEIVASVVSTDTLQLSARNPGKPFTVTVTATNAGGAAATDQVLGSVTVVQASTGPNHIDEPLNYSGGVLPSSGDTLVFTDSAISALYGAEALSGVTLASLVIDQSFVGQIGLAARDGQTGMSQSYSQYRPLYFKVSATLVTIGAGTGQRSQRIRLDLGAVKSTINILGSGQSIDSYKAIVLKGTHAENELNVIKGQVDIAPEAGSLSTINVLRVSFDVNVESDANLRVGAGVTLSTIEQNGGQLIVQSDSTSTVVRSGTLSLLAGAHSSIELTGGRMDWRTTGEVTALSVSNATVDLSKDPRPKSFAAGETIQMYRGAVLNDPFGLLPSGTKFRDNTGGVTINRPAKTTYTVS